MSTFYVYVLLDPRKPGKFRYGSRIFTHQPFYVGKGKGKRVLVHTRTVRSGRAHSTPKANKIRKIFAAGYDEIPVHYVKLDLSEKEAFALEVKLIQQIGRQCFGGPLTNSTDGGEGISGHRHTKASRAKLSAHYRNLSPKEKRLRSQKISKALNESPYKFIPSGCGNGMAKLTPEDVVSFRKLFSKRKITVDLIAETTGLGRGQVRKMLSGISYSEVTYQPDIQFPGAKGRTSSMAKQGLENKAHSLLSKGMHPCQVADKLGISRYSTRKLWRAHYKGA